MPSQKVNENTNTGQEKPGVLLEAQIVFQAINEKALTRSTADMKSRRSSQAVDRFVGRRLKQQREHNNISAEELASALSLPVQKLRQIESGSESIGALSLYEAAQVVGVPVGFFFEGYNEETIAEETAKVVDLGTNVTSTGNTIE